MWLILAVAAVLEVPYVPQTKDTCGAAALAMVMGYWGRETTLAEVAGELKEPDLRGIAGSRLAEYARGRGLQAFAYEGDVEQARSHLAKGRPLITAWKVGRNRFHDVVVIGFDDTHAVVHDPAEGAARRVPLRDFERRWAGAGHWTLLVLPAP